MTVREGNYYNNSEKFIKRVRAAKYYGHCGEKRYNSRIYIIEIKNINNSDIFKE